MTTFVKITDLPLATPLTGSELIEVVQDDVSKQTDIHAIALAAKQLSGFSGRNRIINGAMLVDQRNNGAELQVSNSTAFGADRFYSGASHSGKMTVRRITGVNPAIPFESFYRSFTASGFNELGDSVFVTCRTRVPGWNMRGLFWGTSAAKPVTLSFWMRASIPGDYGISFAPIQTPVRSYVTTVNVQVANAWERKVITVPGCTDGNWDLSTAGGLHIMTDYGSGTNLETTTTDTWSSPPAVNTRTPSCVKPIATTGAFVDYTGWQLEEGTTATPFDHRPYTETLAQCQMFYQEISSPETYLFALGMAIGNEIYIPFRNPGGSMIKIPTVTCSGSASDYWVFASGSQYASPSVPIFAGGSRHAVSLKIQAGSVANGSPAYLAFNPNTGVGKIALSADF